MGFAEECAARGLAGFVLTVATKYGVTVEEIGSKGRSQRLTAARSEIVRHLRAREPPWSFADIGRLLGKRHRATMMRLAEGGS